MLFNGDCFMGTGTVGVACTMMGRNFIGMEIDEKHYMTASDRIRLAQENKACELDWR